MWWSGSKGRVVFGTEGGAYEPRPDSAAPVPGTRRNILQRVQRQERSYWFVSQRAGRRGRAVGSRWARGLPRYREVTGHKRINHDTLLYLYRTVQYVRPSNQIKARNKASKPPRAQSIRVVRGSNPEIALKFRTPPGTELRACA